MNIRPCDLLFYRGKGIVSRTIESVTNSPYSHVALVVDRFHLAETDFLRPVGLYHWSYPFGSFDLYRVRDLTEDQRDRVLAYVMRALGEHYDLLQTLSHLTNKWFNLPLVNFPHMKNCSELIDRAFTDAGRRLLPNDISGTVTPGQLSLSKEIDPLPSFRSTRECSSEP